MRTADRIINHGDYIEIKVADLAEEVVVAIRSALESEGLTEVKA